MAATAPKTLVAKDGFICEVKGVEYLIRQGDVLDPTHPAVKGHEHLFDTHAQGKPTATAA